MTIQYSDLVDKIYSLTLEDKVQLKNLLENNIAESRRAEMALNFKQSKEEFNSSKLHFSSDLEELKKML